MKLPTGEKPQTCNNIILTNFFGILQEDEGSIRDPLEGNNKGADKDAANTSKNTTITISTRNIKWILT